MVMVDVSLRRDLETEMDDESVGKQTRKRSRSVSVDSNSVESETQESGSAVATDYFPASKLFEYQWPLGDEGAEHYMLQEHVKEYLDIRGIQRKYPDLTRRNLDVDERRYLVGRGVVTEIQSNMGLVGLCSEEVLELMAEEHPQKYQEYIAVVQEREFQATLRKKTMESKRIAILAENQDSECASPEILAKSICLAVEYNAKLAEQRRTTRHMYLDTQTKITHIPRRPPVVRELSPESYYPVALLPGQYSDNYRSYTPQEMNRLPMNTAMELLAPEPASIPEAPPISTSSAPSSISVAALSSSLSQSTGPSAANSSKALGDLLSLLSRSQAPPPPPVGTPKTIAPPTPAMPTVFATPIPTPPTPSLPAGTRASTASRQPLQPKQLSMSRAVVCSVCFKGRGSNKRDQPEDLLQCSSCTNSVHPSCYNLSEVSFKVLKSYPWQCLDCKTCQVCSDPNNEDKMVCCDECDKGYHSFCVGLSDIPDGRWSCAKCSRCASCGADSPGKEPGVSWQHESASDRSLQTLCMECASYFRRGCYCPVCLKVYHNDETDGPMVCCDSCDKWIHIECDNITPEQYKELSQDGSKVKYNCNFCRSGEDKKLVTP